MLTANADLPTSWQAPMNLIFILTPKQDDDEAFDDSMLSNARDTFHYNKSLRRFLHAANPSSHYNRSSSPTCKRPNDLEPFLPKHANSPTVQIVSSLIRVDDRITLDCSTALSSNCFQCGL